MSDFVGELADLALSVRLEQLPPALVHEGRRTLVDTMGVILGGTSEKPVRTLARQMATASVDPCSTILGTGLRADPMWAALANGTAGVSHDFDPGNRFLGGHPAVHVLPAALATGERQGCSGAKLLEATIIGYEVAARVGLGGALRPEMHPHGSWPTVGAAAAAALMNEADAASLRQAIDIASTLTLATSWQTAFEGATVRNVYAGFAAAIGVFAAELAQAGFTGEPNSIPNVFGKLAGLKFDPARAIDRLGEQWQIQRGYNKPHASARFLHSALDALVEIASRETIPPEQVEEIEVLTYAFAATMNDPSPTNALAAKFSLPHVLASYLVLHDTGVAAFGADALADPEIAALRARVMVRADAEMDARTPAERPAAVRVRLRGGRQVEGLVNLPRGDLDTSPCGDEELSEKFLKQASAALGPEAAGRLLEMVWSVETVADVRELAALAMGVER